MDRAADGATTIRPPATLSAASQTLSDDDRDILAGISMMVLAIANRHNLADQPHIQEEEEGEPLPCGATDPRDTRRFCQREEGHPGRHRYGTLAMLN